MANTGAISIDGLLGTITKEAETITKEAPSWDELHAPNVSTIAASLRALNILSERAPATPDFDPLEVLTNLKSNPITIELILQELIDPKLNRELATTLEKLLPDEFHTATAQEIILFHRMFSRGPTIAELKRGLEHTFKGSDLAIEERLLGFQSDALVEAMQAAGTGEFGQLMLIAPGLSFSQRVAADAGLSLISDKKIELYVEIFSPHTVLRMNGPFS